MSQKNLSLYDRIKECGHTNNQMMDFLHKVILSYCDSYRDEFIKTNTCHVEIRKKSLVVLGSHLDEPLKHNVDEKEVQQIMHSLENKISVEGDIFRIRVTYAYPDGCNIVARLKPELLNETFILAQDKVFSEQEREYQKLLCKENLEINLSQKDSIQRKKI